MRCCGRSVLLPSAFSPCVRQCHSLSSFPPFPAAPVTPRALAPALTRDSSPDSTHCTHGPTDSLLHVTATTTLPHWSDVTHGRSAPAPAAAVSLPGLRLAPAAAALLEQRVRESVLRQDTCAADVLYFMEAERYATLQQHRQRHGEGSATGHRSASGEQTGTQRVSETIVNESTSSSSSAPSSFSAAGAVRARQLADLMVGRAPAVHASHAGKQMQQRPSDRHGDADQSRTSDRFRQQQRLFALRRSLAYMLADDDSDVASPGGENRGRSLSVLGRRAALSLSLAQDIVSIGGIEECATPQQEEEVEEEADAEGGRSPWGRHDGEDVEGGFLTRQEGGRVGHGRRNASSGDPFARPGANTTTRSSSGTCTSLDHFDAARCVYVYRSLAQPVELTGREVDALLLWCSEVLQDYAGAVAAQIHRRSSSALRASPYEKQSRDGVAESDTPARPSPSLSPSPLTSRTSAVRPPPTLRMAVARHTAPSRDIAPLKDEPTSGSASTAAVSMPCSPPSPEVCEALVAAAAAMVELASAFVALTTTLLRSSSCISSSNSSSSGAVRAGETVSHFHTHGRDLSRSGADEGADDETWRRGQLVCDVVEAVCDTLHVLRGTGGAVLAHSVQVRRPAEAGPIPAACGSSTANRDGTAAKAGSATCSSADNQVHELVRSLSFSDHFVHSVLCSVRESWTQALRLTQRTHEWNLQLRDAVAVGPEASSTSSEVHASGVAGSRAAATPLRSPPPAALNTLLYILAQHGRLDEVLDRCHRHFGLSVRHLFAPVITTAESAPGALRVSPALRLMVYIAAANADPATAARVLHAEASPSAPDGTTTAATATDVATSRRALYTPADCLEHVVRAGVMPQRVLGVTEYAMLLRRMMGTRLPHCRSRTRTVTAEPPKPRVAGCGVGWWLSPSQVWRFSAGYPHHVRATLCLMGFQVNAQRGLNATLSREDLYVVLSVSRQLVTARQRLATRERLPLSQGATTRGEEGAASALHRREQRWAAWGVEERFMPLQLLPNERPGRSASSSAAPRQAAVSLLLLLPLLARRAAPPHNAPCLQSLCAAFSTVQAPPHGAGSAVLQSLMSREMLQVLRAVHYTRDIGSYWETALRTVATRDVTSSSPHRGREGRAAERVVEEVAYALALAAESSLSDSLDATRRLVAPLPFLAPHLSAYTVGALVQRPFRRALVWTQCLSLLPYTPLGSRSQLWLLRRVAQDGEGRRRAFADGVTATAPTAAATVAAASSGGPQRAQRVSPAVATVSHTAEQVMAVQSMARRLHSSRTASLNAPQVSPSPSAQQMTSSSSSSLPPPPLQRSTEASADADTALLTLLLEGHWNRALRVFEESSPRVRVGGAPHVVRLLIEADVWRDLADAQRKPLVRLAVRSSSGTSAGGPTALLEEVLQTSLEHGLWHTGLYFHQSVAAEQPELVQQCRRAQVYAAQLCRGLLGRTSMTRTVAQLTKATRQSQWAEAAACFLRYATGSGAPLAGDTVEAHTAVEAAGKGPPLRWPPSVDTPTRVPSTSVEELRVLAALMNARRHTSGVSSGDDPASSTGSTGPPSFSFFSENGAAVPSELAHVAQTVRFAMLHTSQLWMYALRWLPTAALPLPHAHEVAVRVLCAGNPAMLRALLPTSLAAGAQRSGGGGGGASSVVTVPPSERAVVSAATATALSLVAEARRAHRPHRLNEVAKERHVAVANALQVLKRAGAWEEATLLYEKAVEANCMPYAATNTVLETALQGGAPWAVTLFYFFHMAQRIRPDVAATAVALQACVEGDQWALAFRVLQQSVLTQSAPVPRLVELAVSVALHCGVWARALAAAQQYRQTRDPRLAHTVLQTFVRTRRWDDAVEYFYECTLRGVRPLDASLELAIIASEAASAEYRHTALMVGSIASALEDLYKLSGAVLEHILFVQRHSRAARPGQTATSTSPLMDLGYDLSYTGSRDTAASVGGLWMVCVDGSVGSRRSQHASATPPGSTRGMESVTAAPALPMKEGGA